MFTLFRRIEGPQESRFPHGSGGRCKLLHGKHLQPHHVASVGRVHHFHGLRALPAGTPHCIHSAEEVRQFSPVVHSGSDVSGLVSVHVDQQPHCADPVRHDYPASGERLADRLQVRSLFI